MIGTPSSPSRHKSDFVWDFWYHYDQATSVFHVFFLHADRDLVPDEQHHFHASVGYAQTTDFIDFDWMRDGVLRARPNHWDNTSIWTGDVIEVRDGYLMYYTSRNQETHDGWTQNIGLAYSHNMFDWERVEEFRLEADPTYYTTQNYMPEDDSTHAWRDPYLFRHHGQIYMLLAAKDHTKPLTRRGCVAILRAENNSLADFTALPPIYSPGLMSECEVPALVRDGSDYVVTFSGHDRFNHVEDKNVVGGLYIARASANDEVPDFSSARIETLVPQMVPHGNSILPTYYAGRVIPELGGDVVVFNMIEGGLQRIATQTGWQSVDRNFKDVSL